MLFFLCGAVSDRPRRVSICRPSFFARISSTRIRCELDHTVRRGHRSSTQMSTIARANASLFRRADHDELDHDHVNGLYRLGTSE